MSDVEPVTGDPDERYTLGVLRGALARGNVLELHGSDGSATIRVPDDLRDLLADVVHDLDTDDGLRADGGRDVRSSGETEREFEEEILDATCGGRSIWLPGNKDREDTLYVDSRQEDAGFVEDAVPESLRPNNPNYSVEPDDVQDFRDLPYPDESFSLVVFDPPHIIRSDGMETLTGVMTKKYGCLHAETWQDDLRRGFEELFRVLSPGGTLVFKFADMDTDFSTVLNLSPHPPLFGTTTSKRQNHCTKWFVFYKERSVETETERRDVEDEEVSDS